MARSWLPSLLIGCSSPYFYDAPAHHWLALLHHDKQDLEYVMPTFH